MLKLKSEIQHTPIVDKLKSKLKRKQNELLELLNQRHMLENEILPKLVYHYEVLFSELEDEISKLDQQALLLDKIITHVFVKIKRGVLLTQTEIKEIEDKVMKQHGNSHEKSSFADYVNQTERYTQSIVNEEHKADTQVSKIFRQLAKWLHPDSNEKKEEHLKLWNLVLDAYLSKDLTRLKIYSDIVLSDEKNILNEEDLFDGFRKNIARLMRRIEFEKRRTKRLENEEPYSLSNKLDNPIWIENRRNELNLKLSSLKLEIVRSEILLKAIKDGDIAVLNDTEDEKFQNKFKDNTYFKT
jgi:hypothetical protein